MSSLASFLPPIAHSAVFALDLMTRLLLGCEIWQSLTTGKALKNKKTRKHIQINNAAVLFFLCKYYVEYKSCFFLISLFSYTQVFTQVQRTTEKAIYTNINWFEPASSSKPNSVSVYLRVAFIPSRLAS